MRLVKGKRRCPASCGSAGTSTLNRSSGAGWDGEAEWWRKGDTGRTGRPFECSGIQMTVSDAEFDDLAGQVNHAIEFLADEMEPLVTLMEKPDVREGVLHFGVAQQVRLAYSCRFPARLVELAGRAGLGIDVSLYAVSGIGGFAEHSGDPADSQ